MQQTSHADDIQTRIDTLRDMLERENKFVSDIFESAPVAIIGVSRDNRIQMINRKAEQVLEESRENLLGTSIGDSIPGANPFDRQNGRTNEVEINLPWNDCALSWKSIFIRDDHGEVTGAMLFGSVFESISSNTIWVDRVNTIQSFMAKLAHDFNNLLGGVVGYSSLIKSMVGEEGKVSKYLDALETSVKRLAEVTERLLKFGRGGQPQPMPLDLNKHVSELCNTWRAGNNTINISKNFVEDLDPVNADWRVIENALRALLENAAEAMPNGGDIFVSTERAEIAGPPPNIINYPGAGTYIRVGIRDSGCGMDAETIAKAFMPFFSEREKGRGSGMGLSVAYASIKKHGGYITLESEPGKGTTASVYLPVQPVVENIDIGDALTAGGDQKGLNTVSIDI